MNGKISVVINTLNDQSNIGRAINSVAWADEILICDMHSDDDCAVIAKKMGAKIILHKRLRFVEPARNFAVSHALNEWILILDPDEEIPAGLAAKLQELAKDPGVTTNLEIPRKNIIFGKWMKASMWWPDYNIRFFKKGSVSWSDRIHRPPKTAGQGVRFPDEERWAIIHHHYSSISQFLNRMDRYTGIQAEELIKDGYDFKWIDLINKPVSEFLGRFFANKGYEDGLHGLALSGLQSFSFLIVYLKTWEMREFTKQDPGFDEVKAVFKEAGKEISYWLKYGNLSKNPLKSFIERAKNKLI
ncbi:glycosyltransferase family 2 protein [Candidatus Daviesbacteria bacterium]|nr:glycosyltransferase family 2 protein [Candidatus Daviesbacteria bacterium]